MKHVDLPYILKSGLIHLYALGLASPKERQQVLQWQAQFPELRELIAQLQHSLRHKDVTKEEANPPSSMAVP